MVFLVPVSRDRSGLVARVLSLLASSARSFTSIGPRDSQVHFFLSFYTMYYTMYCSHGVQFYFKNKLRDGVNEALGRPVLMKCL